MTTTNKYLDPRTLNRIRNLELRARTTVEGLRIGQHRSPYKGSSVEFAEHRQYTAGDDTRHVDWKVFGRTDKIFIKQFQAETELRLVLVVDASESMDFGSLDSIDAPGDEWTKYDHATAIAATLAYMATRQSDSVGLAIFDQVVSRYFKPSSQPGTWRQLVTELGAIPRWNPTAIGKVLEQVTGKLTGRSVVVVLSDFFDDLDAIQKGFRMLRHKGHEVLALQVMDPQEVKFPFEDVTMFEGLEEAGELLAEPRALRDAYLQQMQEHTDELAHRCRRMGIDFERFDSGEPLDVAISTFLARRSDRLRVTT
ncbi:MAG: DUF58 domain-containing protein [Planctomycetota bacterium]